MLTISLILAYLVGFFLERSKPATYSSQMLVKPYFDSKYQLIGNIDYFNALISTSDYNTLMSIFSLNEEEVKKIIKFEISAGPETENDRIVKYDRFIKSIDSIRGQDIDYDDFLENRSIISSDLFQIKVESYIRDIFPKLEDGLNSSFTNNYSIKKMVKRDSMIALQKRNISQAIEEVEKLQDIYINVLEEESKAKETKFKLGENLSLSSDNNTKTREYDLLNQEIKLRKELRQLDEKKIQEDVFFDVISSFQKIGSPVNKFSQRYSIIFPIITFIFLCFLYLSIKLIIYVKNYDS